MGRCSFVFILGIVMVATLPSAHAASGSHSGQNQQVKAGGTPEGLSRGDWADIQAQIRAGRYQASPREDGSFASVNLAHGWRIQFAVDGTTTLTPSSLDATPYRIGLRLKAIGYADPVPLNTPLEISNDQSTITYRWDQNLREIWTNSEQALEQWFVLGKRPLGDSANQQLTLEMALDTDLAVREQAGGLHFSNEQGIDISYNKLKVWDSTGRELPAQMMLAEHALKLVVDDAQALYPLTIDPVFKQQAYLKASNTVASAYFGSSVAISGDTLVVGAPGERSSTTGVNSTPDELAGGAGAAYVFIRNGSTWMEQAYLKASNTGANDQFGWSVAISGDTIVVGARYEASDTTGVDSTPNDLAADSGAAYVFNRNGSTWMQEAYLKSANTIVGYQFGWSVAISGDTVVVGAQREREGFVQVGAAYVFNRSGSIWTQQGYLKASDPGNTRFGKAVAISGDTLVGGALFGAYVFTRSSSIWTQQAYLLALDSETEDYFGESVAVSGDTVVVGAIWEDSSTTGVNSTPNESAFRAGAAYVFNRSGSTWTQQAYLKASNTGALNQFGISVGIFGDTVVVGAYRESSSTTGVDSIPNDSAGGAGAAYVFNRSGTTWTQQAYLKASETSAADEFGYSVAISGDSAVIGARYEQSSTTGVNTTPDNLFHNAGAAYVFNIPPFTVGGTVTGLSGSGLVLRNNGGDDLSVSADGGFTFSIAFDDGGGYDVTVFAQPISPVQICSANNNSGIVAGASVTDVTVTCTHVPIANDDGPGDPFVVDEGLMLTLTADQLTANDTDVEDGIPGGDVINVTGAINGTVLDNLGQTFTFTHDDTETASASFTYQVMDSSGASSNTATVNLTVNPVNDPPVANDDPQADVPEDTALVSYLNSTLISNDTVSPGETETIMLTAVHNPVGGSVILNGLQVDFTPSLNFFGPASFRYTLTDDAGGGSGGPMTDTATVSFTITPINDPPAVAFPIPVYFAAGGEDRLIDLVPYFTDPEQVSLNYTLIGAPSAVTINALGQPGLLRVTASPLQVGEIFNFTVAVSDGVGGSILPSVIVGIEESAQPEFAFERYFPPLQQPWYFARISDLVSAPDGTIYLADAERGKVLRFSRDGLLITQFGGLGNDPGEFNLLKLKLAVDSGGQVAVASAGRLQFFEPNGRFKFEFADFGEDVVDLFVDEQDRLYILFAARLEIRSLDDLSGAFDVINLSKEGASVTTGPSGRIYVALVNPSGGNADEIRVYDPLSLTERVSERISTVDADAMISDAAEQLFALGSADQTLRAYLNGVEVLANDLSGATNDKLTAIAFDSAGRLVVATRRRIVGLNDDLLSRSFIWASGSEIAGRFDGPVALDMDETGQITVVEGRNSRVQQFSREGALLSTWDLQQAIAEPDNQGIYVKRLSGSPERILVSTGSALEAFDGNGMPDAGFADPGLVAPGPFGETPDGRLVLTDGNGGFAITIASRDGIPSSSWNLASCQATDLAVGADNLIYVLCEPGVATREIQIYTQLGNKIRTISNLPAGDPRGLALDDRDRIILSSTENEIDLGSGVTTADSSVWFYQSDGLALGSVGLGGYSAGRFNFGGPTAGLDIGPNGELVVSEPGNNRVQILTPAAGARNTKAIVVAGGGDYPENYLWEATQINTNNAYDKLIYQGFTADRILYLHPDPSLDLDGNPATQEVDAAPTIANLAAAFAPGGFAEDADNLIVYAADHGDVNVFRVNPTEVVTASTIAGWLSQLQDPGGVWQSRALPPGGDNGWITFFYEACESGSFQDELQGENLPTNKRLILTTTNQGQNANFIAQGFLSFSYQFWINAFNGFDVRDAFDLANLTIQDIYPEQDPILSLVDAGQLQVNLDDYFKQGGANFSFSARVIGNGTANSFAGPDIMNPSVPAALMNTATGVIEVESIDDPDGIARAWVVIQPPEYRVRDTENPVLELPTIDLGTSGCSGLNQYCATYQGFTSEGDYRIDILAQDVFGNVTKYVDTVLTIAVDSPLNNKAVILASGDSSERGMAFLDNADFAYQALLRQDYVNDLDPDTPNVTNLQDEIRYYTQGAFVGADVGDPSIGQLDNLIVGGFVNAMTQNLVLYIAADYDSVTSELIFPGLAAIGLSELEAFLDDAEAVIQGKIIIVLEGNNTGAATSRLVDGSGRRYLAASTIAGGDASLVDRGGISFSKFFWNSIRDGFALGTAFDRARTAISPAGQSAQLDDNGNGISNDESDGVITRRFFLGPGIARAGNGPLVGSVAPDVIISSEFQNSQNIVVKDVSATSALASVVGVVTVSGTRLPAQEFMLSPIVTNKGPQQVINLGDFQGTYDGFVFAGDYDVSVFAIDENGNPSSPKQTRVRKTAGPDWYEDDNQPPTATQLIPGAPRQRHTLHLASDEDWYLVFLNDQSPRVLEIQLSNIDPGLGYSVRIYDADRFADPLESPVQEAFNTATLLIDEGLLTGLHLVRIERTSFSPTAQSDPSPGYTIGLTVPFGDDPGLVTGLVLDATSNLPIANALILADDGSFTFSCSASTCSGPGEFVMSLTAASVDIDVLKDGYDTQVFTNITVLPRATTSISVGPVLLAPQSGINAPTITAASARELSDFVVQLSGTVDAGGAETTAWFSIGLDPGSLAPLDQTALIPADTTLSFDQTANGLSCGTSYSYQLTAISAGGGSTSTIGMLNTSVCGAVPDTIFYSGFESIVGGDAFLAN